MKGAIRTTTDNITTDRRRAREKELVVRMLDGEERAFGEFVHEFKDRLYSSMLAHVGCRHEAEEIVQETFIKALQHLPRFQCESRLYTWIYRIAWNTSVSRNRKLRKEVSLDASIAEANSSAPESSEPHYPLERRERVQQLQRALRVIEGRHREILVMREFDELSYQEIADLMEIPLGTVRSRLARARERLREELVRIEDKTAADGQAKSSGPMAESTIVDCI